MARAATVQLPAARRVAQRQGTHAGISVIKRPRAARIGTGPSTCRSRTPSGVNQPTARGSPAARERCASAGRILSVSDERRKWMPATVRFIVLPSTGKIGVRVMPPSGTKRTPHLRLNRITTALCLKQTFLKTKPIDTHQPLTTDCRNAPMPVVKCLVHAPAGHSLNELNPPKKYAYDLSNSVCASNKRRHGEQWS